jgi:O-antigen/teichoic acid export membrane protein
MLANAAGQVAFPTFSKMQGDASRMRNAYYAGTQMLSFVAFPVFVSVSLLSEEIVVGVFGPQWSEGATVLGILAIGGMIGAVSWLNHTVMLANGKSGWRLVFGLANVASRIAAFFLVWRWGIAAVATAFVALAFVFACAGFQISRRLIGVEVSVGWRHLYPQLASAVFMGVGIAAVRLTLGDAVPGLVVIGVALTVGIILYAVASWLMSPELIRRAWDLGRIALSMS